MTTLLVMKHSEVIGTLTASDPDVKFAQALGEALSKLDGEGWRVVEVGEPCDEDSSCFQLIPG